MNSKKLFIYSFLILTTLSYQLINAQLIEQWRVDIPPIPDFSYPEWYFDSVGNSYGIRAKYSSINGASRWTFNISKVSSDGLLEWQIEDTPLLEGFFGYARTNVDRYGNIYIVGSTGGVNQTVPCVVKYSSDGVKLFEEAVVPSIVAPVLKIIAWGTDSDGITSAFGDYLIQEGSIMKDYGIAMSISPNGGNISELTFDLGMPSIGCSQANGPKGPDMFGNYIAQYFSFINDSLGILHLVGYNGTAGILWTASSPPSTYVDDHWRLYNYRVSQLGNMYYHYLMEVSKYSPTFQHQWTKNYNNVNVGVLAENNYDESVLIYETGEVEPVACYNADGSLRWRNSLHAPLYFQTATGPEHDIYSRSNYTPPSGGSEVVRINYLTGELVWSDTVDLGPSYPGNRLRVDNNVVITWAGYDRVIKYIQGIEITHPKKDTLMIAGEIDTIRWKGGKENQFLNLQYSVDGGTTYNWVNLEQVEASEEKYGWDIPDDIIGRKAIIKILDVSNGDSLAASDTFKIKPYIITRVDENGEYVAYDINTDRWGFGNYPNDIWPSSWWYGRFDYNNGLDPFSHRLYNQFFADSAFYNAFQFDFPDWPSFVKAFGTDACYWNLPIGRYKSTAVLKWKAVKKIWRGSCFGIAAANALAFRYKDEFVNKYSDFTSFVDPDTIQPADTTVIPVISELFTHQFGNPSIQNDVSGNGLKTPTQTIEDLKEMLKEDNTPIRTITMLKQGGGGHTILAYKLKQDSLNPNIYYVYVYDNSHPNILDARILVDTSHNGGIGLWDPEYAWNEWGGEKGFYLEIPSQQYFNNTTLSKMKPIRLPFDMSGEELIISTINKASISIKDELGNQTGYINNEVIWEIPGSTPLMIKDGSESPPYAYHLPTDNYYVVMNNFTADTINAFFFTGNKSFEYERYGANQNQIDRLFFDGGVSVTNPDNELKKVRLLNIVSDTTQIADKLIVLRSLDIAHNDSVKLENIGNDEIKLISYGSSKSYGIGLEFTSENNYQIFGNSNVELLENTTHIFDPDWLDISNSELIVYVDTGNNGTIDDTLIIHNQLTGIGDDQGSLIPTEYRLEQNYPNPFNNSTVIRYSIPKEGLVSLKIYNAIGEEVAIIVNETKQPGNYEVTFSTNELTSGVYFYRLQAGSFVQTRKMILLK